MSRNCNLTSREAGSRRPETRHRATRDRTPGPHLRRRQRRVAQEVEDSAIAAAEQEAAELRKKAETDATALAKTLSAKRAGAAEAIVKAVTEV